jgi:hypothetical protein
VLPKYSNLICAIPGTILPWTALAMVWLREIIERGIPANLVDGMKPKVQCRAQVRPFHIPAVHQRNGSGSAEDRRDNPQQQCCRIKLAAVAPVRINRDSSGTAACFNPDEPKKISGSPYSTFYISCHCRKDKDYFGLSARGKKG